MLATGGEIVHLCPLDQADSLPRLRFGPCEIRTFSKAEFTQAIQYDRLQRRFPRLSLDIGAFARFDWLVVREQVSFSGTLAKRSGFFRHLDFRMDRDFGAIQPFARTWPPIVEQAVFALLLLPWQDMVEHPSIDWRGLRIPWVYSVPADRLEAPAYPRGPETLSWEPDFYFEPALGEEVETERPFRLPLKDGLERFFAILTDARWEALVAAQASPIFNPLIVHFLVRAFTAEGVDEFLSHVTTIEAGLGLATDYRIGGPRPPIGKKNPGATERVKRRIVALTGDPALAETYGELFDIRSAFIHGRPMDEIPSTARAQARVLACQLVEAFVQAARITTTQRRDAFLSTLCP